LAYRLRVRLVGLLGEPGALDAQVFPSTLKPNQALSDMALTAVLRRMGRGDLTADGFRSAFRDWPARPAAIHARSSSRLSRTA
jgi:hypothetical protein